MGDVIEAPMRKCSGVRASRSFASMDKGVIERELRQASMEIRKVLNSSIVKNC